MNESSDFLQVQDMARLMAQRATDVVWIDGAGGRSRGELGAAIEEVAQACRDAGVEPGSVIVTPGSANFESLAWLFGAALTGAIVAPLRPEREGEVQLWRQTCEIRWHVRNGRIETRPPGATTPTAEALISELRRRRQPGLLLGTAGTTGRPQASVA